MSETVVKALEWEQHGFIQRAVMPFGYYGIVEGRGHVVYLNDDALGLRLPTEEEAKKAAQEDYQMRIRAALA